MTLILTRVDYATVGVTSRGTTRVLPKAQTQNHSYAESAQLPKAPQKFTVGDHDGVLHIFGAKRGEVQLLFKTQSGPKIRSVVLGGAIGASKDKIFVAYDNNVKGFTRKGKMFLDFDTNLIEAITSMYVLGGDLAACSQDLYHRYRDCKDADSYLAGETLLDVVLLPGESVGSVHAVLACADCAVRVLHGTKSPTLLRIPSIPTVLSVYREGHVESKDRVLVGTIDGMVGLLFLQGNKTLRATWLIEVGGAEITSLDTYEIQDGTDILVGRQDGTVEVYAFPEDEDTTPMLRFRYNAGESISTVTGGVIGTPGYPEVLVTTFSGKIFGLTTKPPGLLESEQSNENLVKVREEIKQLEMKLQGDGLSMMSEAFNNPLIASATHRMILQKEAAAYLLSFEMDTGIDNILVQSDTPVELLDVETNDAFVSLSSCDPKEGNYVLATYRCHNNLNRLDMRLRTIEGQPGTLQIYITTQIQPKCSRKITIPIYSLSMHTRFHEDENSLHSGPFNELRLIGGFSVAEMHAWLSLALPDVPDRPLLVEGEATLTYLSALVGTMLKCKYKKGQAIFLGESISTIIILRDSLTREATKRKTKLDVYCDVAEGSVRRVLELLLPRVQKVSKLHKEVKILNALNELELKSNPAENLSTKYQKLIENEASIKAEVAKDPEGLRRLYAVVTDLLVDWERSKGSRSVTSEAAEQRLRSALESLDINQLLQVFLGTANENPPVQSMTMII